MNKSKKNKLYRSERNRFDLVMAMVDVSGKAEIYREATATGMIKLKPQTVDLIMAGKIAKGDPFYTAKIAGVLAAKRTSDLIPLCHPLPLTNVELDLKVSDNSTVSATATVKTRAQTGVEMEALTAVSMALLTVWDMTKQYEKDAAGQYPSTAIEDIHVVKKVKQA
ncbi:MAG TPA: cyclic pyranopterin monophosphate synthase MoaC [Candidatus Binatia bacterium]|nr:cyclic pyranopterin monophosphate synthase MoaC [Candidatus Binatia bacterium]